jgi:hypothetical protein
MGVRVRVVIAGVVLVLAALAGCSSGPSASHSPSPTAAVATTAAAPTPTVSPLDATTQRAICNGLDATLITGGQSGVQNGIQGEESIDHVSQAQVIQAVQAQCPNLSQYMPAQ